VDLCLPPLLDRLRLRHCLPPLLFFTFAKSSFSVLSPIPLSGGLSPLFRLCMRILVCFCFFLSPFHPFFGPVPPFVFLIRRIPFWNLTILLPTFGDQCFPSPSFSLESSSFPNLIKFPPSFFFALHLLFP